MNGEIALIPRPRGQMSKAEKAEWAKKKQDQELGRLLHDEDLKECAAKAFRQKVASDRLALGLR